MKLTKTKLKQIIKEELQSLKEYSPYRKDARPAGRPPKPGENPDYKKDAKPADPKRSRPPKRESVGGIDPDEMTHGEYFVHSRDPTGMEGRTALKGMGEQLDEFSVAIDEVRDAFATANREGGLKSPLEPKDILAFVQQVLGDAQSNQVIDV